MDVWSPVDNKFWRFPTTTLPPPSHGGWPPREACLLANGGRAALWGGALAPVGGLTWGPAAEAVPRWHRGTWCALLVNGNHSHDARPLPQPALCWPLPAPAGAGAEKCCCCCWAAFQLRLGAGRARACGARVVHSPRHSPSGRRLVQVVPLLLGLAVAVSLQALPVSLHGGGCHGVWAGGASLPSPSGPEGCTGRVAWVKGEVAVLQGPALGQQGLP